MIAHPQIEILLKGLPQPAPELTRLQRRIRDYTTDEYRTAAKLAQLLQMKTHEVQSVLDEMEKIGFIYKKVYGGRWGETIVYGVRA